MTELKQALVLTGALLPGFDEAQAWPALAAYLRIDAQRLRDEVLARAPIALKESDDLARLQQLQEGAAAVGAVMEIHAVDASGSVFVLIDNVPRGPLPRRFVAQRIAAGDWPGKVRVAAVGSTQWTPFEPIVAAPTTEPAVVELELEPIVESEGEPDAGVLAPALQSGALTPIAAAPRRAPEAVVDEGEPFERLPPGDAIHAGFWRRSAAYVIDALVLLVPLMIVNVVPLLGMLIGLAGHWLYFTLQESSPAQATLGKRAMGLIVTDAVGSRLSFGRACGRYFGGILSVLTFYVGYMLAGWTERKQALHDMVADTFVVFEDVVPGFELPTTRPPMPWWGWVANVAVFVLPVALVGILAAVALPAYQDYVTRAKVIGIENDISDSRIEIAETQMSGEDCPQGSRSASSPLIALIELAGTAPACTITVTMAGVDGAPALAGETITWTYSDTGAWTCTSTADSRHLPASCR